MLNAKRILKIWTLKLISNVRINVNGEVRFQNQLEGGMGVTYDGGLW